MLFVHCITFMCFQQAITHSSENEIANLFWTEANHNHAICNHAVEEKTLLLVDMKNMVDHLLEVHLQWKLNLSECDETPVGAGLKYVL